MKRYDELVKVMKKEYENEEKEIRDKVEKEVRLEREEEERRREEKEVSKKPEPKKEKQETNKKVIMSLCYKYKHEENLSDRKIAKVIQEKHDYKVSPKTAKKYYEDYGKILEENKKNIEDVKPMIAGGVLPEEVQDNFE
jgi:hypothetical protein